LDEFPNLKGIFRAGIGADNVPIKEAEAKGILVRFPSRETMGIIYEETASFTCGLILRMLYDKVGNLDNWEKYDRVQLADKVLLVIGIGNIGGRVEKKMKELLNVKTYDVLKNSVMELENLISTSDCITLHIPKSEENSHFMNKEKLSLMKNGAILINTARGAIVDEEALYAEIESGRIHAAFDVFWQEPYQGPLKKYHPERFFMTPHVASTCNGFLEGCRESLDSLIKEISHV
jgi:phosphoglycerate dehydrogenase-like enzyme